jgi:hypothetical protein
MQELTLASLGLCAAFIPPLRPQPFCGACIKSGRQDRCIYESIRNKNLADQLEDRVNQLERMVERMEREGQQPGATPQTTGLGMFAPAEPAQYPDVPLTPSSWGSVVEGCSRLPHETHNFL